MFSRIKTRKRFSVSSALTRRWIRSRPGSVLILVIALLVLLALIGTAYLSSTQTERYTSVQNTANTEADLLVDGLILNVESKITNSLFGNNGQQFRPAVQEMATASDGTAPPSTGYNPFTSPLYDDFLAERIPTIPLSTNVPTWGSVSWPVFNDPTSPGNYTFDSPFLNSSQIPLALYSLQNKKSVLAMPTFQAINGHTYPAMLYVVPPMTTLSYSPPANSTVLAAVGGYFTMVNTANIVGFPPGFPPGFIPVGTTFSLNGTSYTAPAPSAILANPSLYTPFLNFAASATGEGIADAGLFKVPVGPIDGITYYGAIRVIDNSSAVNVSTAWTSVTDLPPATASDASVLAVSPPPNYGFFRSNIGLRELLNNNVGASNTTEMDNLNAYRFNQILVPWTASPTTSPPMLSADAYDDGSSSKRTDFTWFSAGDILENQLARRPLYPGQNAVGNKFLYLDKLQSAALASRFSLVNSSLGESVIEQLLPNETYLKPTSSTGLYPSTPYSPAQVISPAFSAVTDQTTPGYWYDDLFNYHTFDPNWVNIPATPAVPIRTLLTGSNPVSNGIPSRVGNTTSGPPAWVSGNHYNFGDWVTDTVGTVTNSYVCLQPITAASPAAILSMKPSTALLPNPPAPYPVPPDTYTRYWAQMPFTYQPVKASINTASFEQLWLNFCQMMTDTVTTPTGAAGLLPQWLPPLIPSTTTGISAYGEEQIPQFRSVIRDNRSYPILNHVLPGDPASPNTGQPLSTNPSPTYATRVQLTPMQMVQLRAAIAAINTVGIRNTSTSMANHTTRSRHIVLADTSGAPAFDVEVFANDIQPFIGQMYANTSNSFIAIQLVNPYPVPITITSKWMFATINRNAALSTAALSLGTTPSVVTGTLTIPAATMQSSPSGGMVPVPQVGTVYDGTAPANFKMPTNAVACSGLAAAIGQELVILRPRRYDGTPTKSPASDPIDYFDETDITRTYDLVPVDQLDMTGTDTGVPGKSDLYYRRAADSTKGNTNTPAATFAWNFLWPGFYTPYNTFNTSAGGPAFTKAPDYTPSTVPQGPAPGYMPFSQPILPSSVDPVQDPKVIPDFDHLCYGPAEDPTNVLAPISANQPTYNTITLQLTNTSLPGGNPVGTAPMNRFPFGGFTRNADLLQIPFIGAYRISDYNRKLDDPANSMHQFYEMNSVTMDASLANDSTLQPSAANTSTYASDFPKKVLPQTDAIVSPAPPYPSTETPDAYTDPFVEQIGHFCPIGDTSTANTPAQQLDFGYDTTTPTPLPSKYWHYHWTKKLFDYFTVQAPNDDYFPNVDPDVDSAYYDDGTGPTKYPRPSVTPPPPALPIPAPVQSSPSTSANVGEDIVGVDGLININTAPWPVLATLPFVPRNSQNKLPQLTDNISFDPTTGLTGTAADNIDDNVNIAKAIVYYRATNGPFRSIMDLYNVPAFRMENDAILKVSEPAAAQGVFSGTNLPSGTAPLSGGIIPTGADGARFDFEERFLLLNQISNLITTRSDTFTCYVDLQGWRNVGTGNPSLAVERRKAFIFDVNAYTPTYKNPIYYPVPGN